MSHAPAPQQHYTYADYLTWPPEERWEIIDGIAYAMTPAPSREHQSIVVELTTQLHTQLRGQKCQTYVSPFDVRLPRAMELANDATTVVQPDISVICDEKKLDERGCVGAPDFIIEIISPGNGAMEIVRKLRLYEEHQVREYWIIHPFEKLLNVYLAGENNRYTDVRPQPTSGKVNISVLPGIVIDFDLIFSASGQLQTKQPPFGGQ